MTVIDHIFLSINVLRTQVLEVLILYKLTKQVDRDTDPSVFILHCNEVFVLPATNEFKYMYF